MPSDEMIKRIKDILRSDYRMTRLDRIRADFDEGPPYRVADVGWLLRTVDLLQQCLESCECSSWPCPLPSGQVCRRCTGLARLKEPNP